MATEEAQTKRRRGRPPGSKTGTRRKRAAAGDLVGQLNAMVAGLIKKNRQLQRQVAKLTERAGRSAASKGVERGIRTLQRRVKKALGTSTRSGRKAAPANGRRKKKATTRRRRTAS